MEEIGGFFSIELDNKREYHANAIKLNSGRNAFWYLLKTIKPYKIYLPYYICNSLLEPIEKENLSYDFYHIDSQFEPRINKLIKSNDLVVYINYFGVNNATVHKLCNRYKNLVIDNAQSFFSKPFEMCHTFYSPRKFFGVPDGGYLYTNSVLNKSLKRDISWNRCKHLLQRLDDSAHMSYESYMRNESMFSHRPLKLMSNITQNILSSIDYESVKLARERNFLYLHQALAKVNKLNLFVDDLEGPMVYPLLISKGGLKDFLIKNKIYVATYWKEVLDRVDKNTIEYKFARDLVPLPVDQRLNLNDMSKIVDKISNFI
jgi:hypothetical protein